MSYLAHVFEEEDALHQLEKFVSINGPTFYNLKVNEKIINKFENIDKIDAIENIVPQKIIKNIIKKKDNKPAKLSNEKKNIKTKKIPALKKIKAPRTLWVRKKKTA